MPRAHLIATACTAFVASSLAGLVGAAGLAGCAAAEGASGPAGSVGESTSAGPEGSVASGASGATMASGIPGAPGATGASSGPGAGTHGGSSAPDAGASAATMGGLHIDESETSVSGLSSGAFMAVQFHVAFSSIMKGAAIFAGGPFYCAKGSQSTATSGCMYPSTPPDIAPFVAITKQYASSGAIDDPSHLASQKVFLFGGADDHTVNPVVMDSLDSYYKTYISAAAIDYVSRRPGTSHTMPTVSYGTTCDESMSPYIGNCNYDGAGLALAQIYGALSPAATTLSGHIVTLSQGQFIASPSSHSLAASAYAYVPASCAAGETCRVHVAFHGCEQNVAAVGSDFYAHAGYNPWADTNHLVVLYPQTTTGGSNFEGCWDWYGYDSPDYATKTGPQMAMVKAMIDYLASGAALGAGAASDAGAPGLPGVGATDAAAWTFPSLDAGGGFGAVACVTDSNEDHVLFGRAHVSGSDALANGSNDPLGAHSALVWTSLKQTTTGYYVKVPACE